MNPTFEVGQSCGRWEEENQAVVGGDGSMSASSISEYLMETLPGWRVDEFLDSHPLGHHHNDKNNNSSISHGYCKVCSVDLLIFINAFFFFCQRLTVNSSTPIFSDICLIIDLARRFLIARCPSLTTTSEVKQARAPQSQEISRHRCPSFSISLIIIRISPFINTLLRIRPLSSMVLESNKTPGVQNPRGDTVTACFTGPNFLKESISYSFIGEFFVVTLFNFLLAAFRSPGEQPLPGNKCSWKVM